MGFGWLAAKLSGVALPVKRQEHKVYVDEVKELKAQQHHDVFRGRDGDEQTFGECFTITHAVDEQKHAKVQSIFICIIRPTSASLLKPSRHWRRPFETLLA